MPIARYLMRCLFLSLTALAFIDSAHAAAWVKLQDDKTARLMLDKQSILSVDKYQRAWVKVDYKALQSNMDYPEKTYTNAKMLWFFDCDVQKTATTQVFQYLADNLVYSAAVDLKAAKFNEPVPESEVDLAMRYVCKTGQVKSAVANDKNTVKSSVNPNTQNTETKAGAAPAKPAEAENTAPEKPAAENPASVNPAPVNKTGAAATAPAKKGLAAWSYTGKTAPAYWAKLSADYASCDSGRNQSPVNINKTLHSAIKPLKTLQRFPASSMVNNGHSVQVNFKSGNILVVDGVVYQMKQVDFHAPSEHTVQGKSYPLEAQFLHTDNAGNTAILAVLFEEGAANQALSRLWEQIPTQINKPVDLKSRTLPSELIPQNKPYYRYSGSLSSPPCTEGVVWLVMKTPMTASKAQLASFKAAIPESNNRPVQALNGRLVVE